MPRLAAPRTPLAPGAPALLGAAAALCSVLGFAQTRDPVAWPTGPGEAASAGAPLASSSAAQPESNGPEALPAVATVRVRGGLGALVGFVASGHRTSMEDCDEFCRPGRDAPRGQLAWAATGRLGFTTDHVGVYYYGAGPIWAYSVVGDNGGGLEVSLPHSLLVGLLPSPQVEIALGPTFSWVGAWDPWAFGGTLVLSAMIEPTVSPEGSRHAPSISAVVTPLVDTFGEVWVLLGLSAGYDWY